MGLFKRKDSLHASAHIKGHTAGTSNEVSFSVLDAARQNADGESPSKEKPHIGKLSLFTLPGKKIRVETPRKEQGLHLSSGGFVPIDDSAPTPLGMARDEGMSLGEANAAIHIESSDGTTVSGASPKAVRSWGPRAGGRGAGKGKGESTASSSGQQMSDGLSVQPASQRKRGKKLVAVVSVAVCVALVAVGAMIVLREVDFAFVGSKPGTVQGSLAKIAKADKTIIEMDAILSEPIETEDKDEIGSVLEALPAAKKQLESARSSVVALEGQVKAAEDKEAAENALEAIDVRMTMIDSGEILLRQAYSAVQTMDALDRAWDKLREADSSARKGNELVSMDPSAEEIAESIAKTDEAIAGMGEALSLIESAAQLYPNVDLSAHRSYLELRIESLQHAKASSQALAEEDTDGAVSENTAYNDIDAKAASIAKSLPENIDSLVVDVYQQAVQENIASYAEARSRAGVVDARLRSYLQSLK